MKNQELKGTMFLLLAALIWGFAVVMMKSGGDNLGPWAFSGIRSLLGCLSMIPVCLYFYRKKTPEEKAAEHHPALLIKGTMLSGLIVTGYMIPAQTGLAFTTVGKSGFITSLYIIIVPIIGILLKQKISKRIWTCVLIATAGFYLMCMTEGLSAINRGDLLILCGSVFCALHIFVVDAMVKKVDPIQFVCLQFFFAGSFCMIGALIIEQPTSTEILQAIIPLLYTGICSCGVGYMFQTLGQKYVAPAKASLLLSSETIFTMFFGFLVFHEVLSGIEYIGCALIFFAIIFSQIDPKEKGGTHIAK